MKRLSLTLSAIAIFAIVAAACSGSGGGGLIGVGNQTYKIGYIHASLKSMPEKTRHHIDDLVARALRASHRNPKFLPGSTTEVDFNLMSVDGNAVTGTSPYSFTLIPANSCSTGSPSPGPSGSYQPSLRPRHYLPSSSAPGFNCTVTSSAPAAADQFDIIACAGTTGDGCLTDSNAVILSESYTTIDVPPGGTATAQFSLNPVVGGLGWASNTPWANGNVAPTWNASDGFYECYAGDAHPRGGLHHHTGPSSYGCYDPILDGTPSGSYPSLVATPQYDDVSLNVFDGEGDTIIPASGGGGQYGYPIYINGATGGVDDITVTCADSHVQFLGPSPANVPDTSPVAAADLANGFTGATNASMTSPVTNGDGSASTDFNDASVTVYGNNGEYINFDGGSANYSADQSETCTAQDSAGTTPAPYFVGVGQGTITWNGNARRFHHQRHR